jgi:hypothetical protein
MQKLKVIKNTSVNLIKNFKNEIQLSPLFNALCCFLCSEKFFSAKKGMGKS